MSRSPVDPRRLPIMNIKRFSVFSVLSILCLALLGAATAQTIFTGTTTLLSGGTNNVAATATNSVSLRIDTPRASEFVLNVSARPRANATNFVDLYLVLYPSGDGSTIANVDAVVYRLTGTTNSSGLVIGTESITAGAVPYYFITQIGNADAIAVTNLTVSYGAKVRR